MRARRQARHLEPDRDPGRGRATSPRPTSSASSRARGYGDFKTAVGEEVAAWLSPGARALPGAARGRRPRIEELPRDRRREGARASPRRGGRRARGHGRRARPHRPPSLRGVRVAQLELDLDVFAGPFDLLLSLILREELDLLEVDLAEIVVSYLDHLESREQLDLESATEFLVLIAALLELKSRLMLPGEEVEELDELGARRGRRGAHRADAAVRALPRPRARTCAERHEHGQRLPVPHRAAARSSAPVRWSPPSGLRPGRARRRAGRRCCARRRRSTSAHMAMPRGHRRRAARAPARAAARAALLASTRRSRAPTA